MGTHHVDAGLCGGAEGGPVDERHGGVRVVRGADKQARTRRARVLGRVQGDRAERAAAHMQWHGER